MLNHTQVATLKHAIQCYSFPFAVYDFHEKKEVTFPNAKGVETYIFRKLRSQRRNEVIDGLSNVLFWGHYNAGYRDYRVQQFRKKVTQSIITSFQKLVTDNKASDLFALKTLKLPQFSGASFLSKVAMFLKSSSLCVLDLQIARLAEVNARRALNQLTVYSTSIPATRNNSNVYHRWCAECLEISKMYFARQWRPVDIERGFFHMVQTSRLSLARKIYEDFK
jgi:hypothetical protein